MIWSNSLIFQFRIIYASLSTITLQLCQMCRPDTITFLLHGISLVLGYFRSVYAYQSDLNGDGIHLAQHCVSPSVTHVTLH